MEEYGRSAMEAARSATTRDRLGRGGHDPVAARDLRPGRLHGGRVGRFFNSFGFTVGFAILMSMFVSFTLTPMLCSRFLEARRRAQGKQRRVRLADDRRGLRVASEAGRCGIAGSSSLPRSLTFAATPVMFGMVGIDFVPRDDQSEFEVAITLPEGYTLDRADKLLAEIEGRLKQVRGVTHVFTIIGDTTGRVAKGQGDVTAGHHLLPAGRPGRARVHAVRRDGRCPRDHERLSRPARRRAGRGRLSGHRLPPGGRRPESRRAGPRQAASSMPTRSRPGWRRRAITSTSTRACRCASRNCGCASTASGPRTWACRCRRSRRRSECWSAASRSASTRKGTSNTTSGCGPSSRSATIPQALTP